MYSKLIRRVSKKTLTLCLLLLFGLMGISAVEITKDGHQNLKVLPKDISDEKLDKIMLEDFGDALGVSCDYCHVENKDTKKLDYAVDTRPEKETARDMIRMTLELNKTYFKLEKPAIGDSTLVITCYTCHRESPVPTHKK